MDNLIQEVREAIEPDKVDAIIESDAVNWLAALCDRVEALEQQLEVKEEAYRNLYEEHCEEVGIPFTDVTPLGYSVGSKKDQRSE